MHRRDALINRYAALTSAAHFILWVLVCVCDTIFSTLKRLKASVSVACTSLSKTVRKLFLSLGEKWEVRLAHHRQSGRVLWSQLSDITTTPLISCLLCDFVSCAHF